MLLKFHRQKTYFIFARGLINPLFFDCHRECRWWTGNPMVKPGSETVADQVESELEWRKKLKFNDHFFESKKKSFKLKKVKI